jgi:mono/diheme cytochrome c family protein
MKRLLLIVVVIVVVLVVVGFAMLPRDGFSARGKPTAFEEFAAKTARRLAAPKGARELKNPVAATPEVLKEARLHFADHCATCHANNGSGQTEIGRNLYPKAPDMRKDGTQRLTDGEIYYIIENGVRLTGMPAWGHGDTDDKASWALVHFIRHLPQLTREEEKEMKAANPKTEEERKEEQEEEEFMNGPDDPGTQGPASHDSSKHDSKHGSKQK